MKKNVTRDGPEGIHGVHLQSASTSVCISFIWYLLPQYFGLFPVQILSYSVAERDVPAKLIFFRDR